MLKHAWQKPVIFFTPWITWWGWKRLQTEDWMTFVAVISAWLGFGLTIVLSFEYDRDIVRFTEYSRWIWIILLTIMLFEPASKGKRFFRIAGIASLALMVFGGSVIAGPMLSAATQTVLTEDNINRLDAQVAEDVWDHLAPDSLIFDPQGWRGTMLTGRLTRVVEGNMSYNYTRSQRWEAMLANPSTRELLEQGLDPDQLDVDALAQEAIRKISGEEPIQIELGEYEVILEPYAVSELLSFLGYLGFHALAVQEGRSFFSNRFGEKMVDEKVTIYDDGLDPEGLQVPFDFEGIPKKKITFFDKGVAKEMTYDSFTAGREGKDSTGHGFDRTQYSRPHSQQLFYGGGEVFTGGDDSVCPKRHLCNPVPLYLCGW